MGIKMKHINAALRSKTVWFAFILSGLSLIQGLVLEIPISPLWQAIIGMIVSFAIIVLRFITNQSVYAK